MSILESKPKEAENITHEKSADIVLTLKESTLQVFSEAERSLKIGATPTALSTHEDMIVEDQYEGTPKIDERAEAFKKEPERSVIDEKISEKQNENAGIQEMTKLVDKDKNASRRVLKTPEREIKKPTAELEKTTPRTRKRAKSTSSNKSIKEPDSTETKTEETKIPQTRKRSQSITSTKSEDKTPERPNTRRRAKTPTGSEAPKILTRRASKEISEKVDEFESSIIDESATPKRRTTWSQSTQDDVISIASGSTVRSTRSTR